MPEKEQHSELAEAKKEQMWEQGQMLIALDQEGKAEQLPTDIDIETVVLNGNRNRLEGEKDKDKNPLVVVLGIGEDINVGKQLLQSLAKDGRQVICISLPGIGDSSDPTKEWYEDSESGDWKRDFTDYGNMINQTLNLLVEQGVIDSADKIDMVGHSLGGYIVSEYANRNKGRVGSLDLIAPGGYKKVDQNFLHFYPKTVADFTVSQFREIINERFFKKEEEIPDIIRSMWLRNFLKTDKFKKAKLMGDETEALPRLKKVFWEAEVVLQGKLEQMLEENSEDIPTRIIIGEHDKLFPPADYSPIVERVVGNGGNMSMEVVADTGHYGCVIHPDEYAKLINN